MPRMFVTPLVTIHSLLLHLYSQDNHGFAVLYGGGGAGGGGVGGHVCDTRAAVYCVFHAFILNSLFIFEHCYAIFIV